MAVCAFQIKNVDNIAKVIPGIYSADKKIKGGYLIDITALKEYEDAIIEAYNFASKKGFLPPIKRPLDPKAFFILPDLRYLEIDFYNSYASTLLHKIHKNK